MAQNSDLQDTARVIQNLIALYDKDKVEALAARLTLEATLHADKPRSITTLKQIFQRSLEERNANLQLGSAYYLADLAKADATEILLSVLKDERFQKRYFVYYFLGLTNDIRSVPALLEALDSDDNRDTEFAQSALTEMGETIIPAIFEAFHTGSGKVRKGAAQRLGFYPTHALSLPTLLEALHDSETGVRYEAALGLHRFYCKEAVESLLGLIYDPDRLVRHTVYTSLIILDPLTALKTLLDLLRCLDEEIRKQVAQILIRHPEIYLYMSSVWNALKGEATYPFNAMPSLTPPSVIMNYLFSTELIYRDHRTCDVVASGLKAIHTPEALAILETWEKSKRL